MARSRDKGPSTEIEALQAKKLLNTFSEVIKKSENLEKSVFELAFKIKRGKLTNVTLPPFAIKILIEALQEMAEGRSESVETQDEILSTQEAADFLNVSRPYVVKLIDENKLPAVKVGNRRRIRFEDLLRYKKNLDVQREKALQALAEETEKLGLEF